jgi:hypothetical protein
MVFFVPKAPLRVTQADDAPHVHPHPSARYNAAMCKRKQKEHTFAKRRSCPESNRGCRKTPILRSESGVITAT